MGYEEEIKLLAELKAGRLIKTKFGKSNDDLEMLKQFVTLLDMSNDNLWQLIQKAKINRDQTLFRLFQQVFFIPEESRKQLLNILNELFEE